MNNDMDRQVTVSVTLPLRVARAMQERERAAGNSPEGLRDWADRKEHRDYYDTALHLFRADLMEADLPEPIEVGDWVKCGMATGEVRAVDGDMVWVRWPSGYRTSEGMRGLSLQRKGSK